MTTTKGIILAGGSGSRLYPLTKVTNKHLLPVGDKPMIYHSIHKLTQAGITDILVISGTDHLGSIVSLLGSGAEFGCSLTYRVQDEAGGIAQALGIAESFVNGGRCIVILGDNIFENPLGPFVSAFEAQPCGARLLLIEHENPHRFGVATLGENQKLLTIVEKPKQPASNCIVTGIYAYDSAVFDYIRACTPSQRNELEITDVNNLYIQDGNCYYDILSGWWSDAGTFESLYHASQLIHDRPIH
jgi:glucose-1-phosphate thymidylyltransferase